MRMITLEGWRLEKIGGKVQRNSFLMLNFKLEEKRDYAFVVIKNITPNTNVKPKNRGSNESQRTEGVTNVCSARE